MKRSGFAFAGLAVLFVFVAGAAEAQERERWEDRGDDRWEYWNGDDRAYWREGGRGWDVVWADRDFRRPERYGDRYRKGRKGPPFCSNGRGHPVHGLEWCRRKGFGVYAGRGLRRGNRARLDRGGLIDVLGEVVLGRVDRERRRLGARGGLEGRWLRAGHRGMVLQIRAGHRPIAELVDFDGDGRVDVVRTPRR